LNVYISIDATKLTSIDRVLYCGCRITISPADENKNHAMRKNNRIILIFETIQSCSAHHIDSVFMFYLFMAYSDNVLLKDGILRLYYPQRLYAQIMFSSKTAYSDNLHLKDCILR
jgi:hypothetical protein